MANQQDFSVHLDNIRARLTQLLTVRSEWNLEKRAENTKELEEIGRELRSILNDLRERESTLPRQRNNRVSAKRKRDLKALIDSVQKLQSFDSELRRISLVPNNLALYAELLHNAEESDEQVAKAAEHFRRVQILTGAKETKTYSEIAVQQNPIEFEPRPVMTGLSYVILGMSLVVGYISRRNRKELGKTKA